MVLAGANPALPRIRFSVRIDGGLEPALGVRIRRFHHYKKKFFVTGMFPDPHDFEALLVLGQEEMDDDPFLPIDCEVQEMIFEFERTRLLHLQDYLLYRIQRAGYVLEDEDENKDMEDDPEHYLTCSTCANNFAEIIEPEEDEVIFLEEVITVRD